MVRLLRLSRLEVKIGVPEIILVVVRVLRLSIDELKNGVMEMILVVVRVLWLRRDEVKSEVTGWTVEETRKEVWGELWGDFRAEGNEVTVGCMRVVV